MSKTSTRIVGKILTGKTKGTATKITEKITKGTKGTATKTLKKATQKKSCC